MNTTPGKADSEMSITALRGELRRMRIAVGMLAALLFFLAGWLCGVTGIFRPFQPKTSHAEDGFPRERLEIEKLRIEREVLLEAAKQTRELADREWQRVMEASRRLLEASARPVPRLYPPRPVDAPLLQGRAWGPEQATGEPTRPERGGDYQFAWATLKPNDGEHWLELRYDRLIAAIGVNVYETFNPGALIRVGVFDEQDRESVAWQGRDPVEAPNGAGVSAIRFGNGRAAPMATRRIRLYLDTDSVDGWNEIDAAGLLDPDGREHWAVTAMASSTYAERPDHPAPARLTPMAPAEPEREIFYEPVDIFTPGTTAPVYDCRALGFRL